MRGLKPPPPSELQLVEIEKPIYGGAFLARLEGKAVFVPLTLPGEQARVRIVQSKPATRLPRPNRLSAPPRSASHPPARTSASVAAATTSTRTTQRNSPSSRPSCAKPWSAAALPLPAEIAVLSGNPWAYRNRIRLAFDATGNLGYRGRRSHAVVPIRECPIAAPLLVKAAQAFAQVVRGFAPALRPTEISLFCNSDETALLATVFTASPAKLRFDELAQALHERIPALAGAELVVEGRPGQQQRTIAQWGATSLAYRAAGFDYRVDHGAFFQVNRWLVDALVEQVTAGHSGKLAWDLFAGVGLFARQLTARFERVVAVESAPSATAALEQNSAALPARPSVLRRCPFSAAIERAERPDLIVVDPPRTGLGAETCALLGEIAAPAVVYVSCDPATLARDLRALIGSGYQIQSITLADLFPQTFHLETVVQLRRA